VGRAQQAEDRADGSLTCRTNSRAARYAIALAITGLAAILVPGLALAREYDDFVSIESDDDLYNLLEENTIDQDSFDSLQELLERGVDLNRASRDAIYELPNLSYVAVDAILAYRAEAGSIDNPAALVSAGILSEKELLALAPFLIMSDGRPGAPFGAKGWARFSTLGLAGEARVPGMALQVRASAQGGLNAGISTILTRDRLGAISYDSSRRGLLAALPSAKLQLAKAFVKWDHQDYGLVAGTYSIGFGQRLTFDNTGRFAPNGFEKDDAIYRGSSLTVGCRESTGELSASPCTGDEASMRVTPDFRWIPRLVGVAGGHRRLELGTGHLQAFGFFSYQRKSAYQYDILDRKVCTVEQEAAGSCDLSADFNVYVKQEDPFAPAPEFKFSTLTGVYDELLVGGNVAYWFGERAQLGITGYGAAPQWKIPEMELDFRRAARTPFGGPYGAVGINGSLGFAWWDLGAELARSADSMGAGGGGFGGILRGTGSWKKRELELSARYYGADFVNPYARPIAAADELDGNRARDEAGLRARFKASFGRGFDLRAGSDLWAQPSTGVFNNQTDLRLSYQLSDAIRVSGWGLIRDKDLSLGGRAQCYETFSGVLDPGLGPDGSVSSGCAGMKLQGAAQVRYEPFKRWSISLQYQNAWLDDGSYQDRFRQDRSVWVIFMVKPLDSLRIRGRVRYLYEDVSDAGRLERWWWSYLEVSWSLPQMLKLRARYDLVIWTDERSSTSSRLPNPEHWFWLTAEARF